MAASQMVDGFRIPDMSSPDMFRSAVRYKPRDDDVFLVTYPKCGTTWTQHMIALIYRQGQPLEHSWTFIWSSPYLEVVGAQAAETMQRPGVIKLHLPFHLTPWSDKAKYIYATRNPKDTCVSYYHHSKIVPIPLYGFTGTFDEFFEVFMSGEMSYGDYFDHLLGWYEHRKDPNVLFMTYEEMKEDQEAAILKIASFLDDEKFAKPLRQDRRKLECILKYSSLQEMKVKVNPEVEQVLNNTEKEAAEVGLPDEMVKMLSKMNAFKPSAGDATFKPTTRNFVRKGIIGDWKNYFSEDQSRRMDEKFSQRTKGTEIPNFWKNYI